jgi:hypothetical protein
LLLNVSNALSLAGGKLLADHGIYHFASGTSPWRSR